MRCSFVLHLFFLAVIISTALLLGNEFCVSAFMHPALTRKDHRGFLPAIQTFASLFGAVIPFWMGATLCAHAVLLVVTWAWSWQASLLLLAACILWLGIITFSVLGPVPLNNKVKAWSLEALPADWEVQRRRWDRLNAVRVVLVAVAFVCLILAYKNSPVGRPERWERVGALNASQREARPSQPESAVFVRVPPGAKSFAVSKRRLDRNGCLAWIARI